MSVNFGWVLLLWVVLIFPGECFVIPKVHFEVLHPRGLRVSIPDVAGIRLFSFHGVLNEAIRVNQPGTILGEVAEAKDDRWTFTDPRVIIKGDDVINYWIYVQFNNLGYNMEGKHVVTQASISPNSSESASPECSCSAAPIHHHYHYHYYNMPEGSPPGGNDSQRSHQDDAVYLEKLSSLDHEMNRTRDLVSYVDAQILPLERELRMLQEMVNFLQSTKRTRQISNELLLLGPFPTDIPFLMDFLEALLREKLSIDNISEKILNVRYPCEGEIVFEVSSMADKVLLLKKAKQKKLIEAGYILMNNPSDP